MSNHPKRLLVVVRWPLGGIRTYMRYVYAHMGNDWRITIMAADVHENSALREDVLSMGATLITAPSFSAGFLGSLMKTIHSTAPDLIQSHGFISGLSGCLANLPFHVPHVLTVHGVLEERLLGGWAGRLKRSLTSWSMRSVDAVYAVSEDILQHVRDEVPGLEEAGVYQTAIPNGIETSGFLSEGARGAFRDLHGISREAFVFGFLGRFMPQKGFDRIIDAMAMLEASPRVREDFLLVALGSGDFLDTYKRSAKDKGVEHRIRFFPFQRDVSGVYRDLDAVVMPSNWEACPLQPMEALVSGVPVIASDCIGLREVVANTPAIVVPGGVAQGLADAMLDIMNNDRRKDFEAFRPAAAARYDVCRTAARVHELFDKLSR